MQYLRNTYAQKGHVYLKCRFNWALNMATLSVPPYCMYWVGAEGSVIAFYPHHFVGP